MKVWKKPQFPAIIAHRIAVFFFLMCLFTTLLYVLGTAQGFMDDTQFILLKLIEMLGILLTISSLISIILDLVFNLTQKKIRYLGWAFLYGFFGIFGACAAYTASFIVLVSRGF